MRTLFPPVIIALMLAGFTLSYAQNSVSINLKQLVRNQIAQIKTRGIKQVNAPSSAEMKTQPQANMTEVKSPMPENTSLDQKTTDLEKKIQTKEKSHPENKPLAFMKSSLSSKDESGDGLFLEIFILLDLALASVLFVFWRRKQLKTGMAEKAKFKKNITKLRSEGKFRRKPQVSRADEVRKRLQLDPVIDTEDKTTLVKHARKLSVPSGELFLASRIRSLERARE